jgi:hypothetical protein
MLLGGAIAGLLLTFLVYVPAGAPDAAEVTFALGLFTIGGGLGIGWVLRYTPFMAAGRAFLGLALGALLGFVLVFFTPILGS